MISNSTFSNEAPRYAFNGTIKNELSTQCWAKENILKKKILLDTDKVSAFKSLIKNHELVHWFSFIQYNTILLVLGDMIHSLRDFLNFWKIYYSIPIKYDIFKCLNIFIAWFKLKILLFHVSKLNKEAKYV